MSRGRVRGRRNGKRRPGTMRHAEHKKMTMRAQVLVLASTSTSTSSGAMSPCEGELGPESDQVPNLSPTISATGYSG
jgi:hypothetical protein